MDIRQKQRAVIEFVVLGGKSPTIIFRILEKIRGDPAIAAIKKWLSRIKGEEPICQPALLSNAICRRLKSQCFYLCLVGFFFKENVNEWVAFACDETGPADESKRTKRVQGWSRLNWLGGILIIVSWHIHFNKLLMPLTPVCCFVN